MPAHLELDDLTEQTSFLSSPTQIRTTQAYQDLLDESTDIVPILIQALQDDHPCSYAIVMLLRDITNEDPVPAGARFDFQKVIDAWVDWGKQHVR